MNSGWLNISQGPSTFIDYKRETTHITGHLSAQTAYAALSVKLQCKLSSSSSTSLCARKPSKPSTPLAISTSSKLYFIFLLPGSSPQANSKPSDQKSIFPQLPVPPVIVWCATFIKTSHNPNHSQSSRVSWLLISGRTTQLFLRNRRSWKVWGCGCAKGGLMRILRVLGGEMSVLVAEKRND